MIQGNLLLNGNNIIQSNNQNVDNSINNNKNNQGSSKYGNKTGMIEKQNNNINQSKAQQNMNESDYSDSNAIGVSITDTIQNKAFNQQQQRDNQTQLSTAPQKKEKKEIYKLIIPDVFKEQFDQDSEGRWKQTNIDVTDFFNYGFCEQTFRAYANKARAWRAKYPVGDNYEENKYQLKKMNDKTPLEYGGCSNPFDEGLLETPQNYSPFDKDQFISIILENYMDYSSYLMKFQQQKTDMVEFLQRRNVLTKYVQKHDENHQDSMSQDDEDERIGDRGYMNSFNNYQVPQNYAAYKQSCKFEIDFIALQQQIMHNISQKNEQIHLNDSEKIYFLNEIFKDEYQIFVQQQKASNTSKPKKSLNGGIGVLTSTNGDSSGGANKGSMDFSSKMNFMNPMVNRNLYQQFSYPFMNFGMNFQQMANMQKNNMQMMRNPFMMNMQMGMQMMQSMRSGGGNGMVGNMGMNGGGMNSKGINFLQNQMNFQNQQTNNQNKKYNQDETNNQNILKNANQTKKPNQTQQRNNNQTLNKNNQNNKMNYDDDIENDNNNRQNNNRNQNSKSNNFISKNYNNMSRNNNNNENQNNHKDVEQEDSLSQLDENDVSYQSQSNSSKNKNQKQSNQHMNNNDKNSSKYSSQNKTNNNSNGEKILSSDFPQHTIKTKSDSQPIPNSSLFDRIQKKQKTITNTNNEPQVVSEKNDNNSINLNSVSDSKRSNNDNKLSNNETKNRPNKDSSPHKSKNEKFQFKDHQERDNRSRSRSHKRQKEKKHSKRSSISKSISSSRKESKKNKKRSQEREKDNGVKKSNKININISKFDNNKEQNGKSNLDHSKKNEQSSTRIKEETIPSNYSKESTQIKIDSSKHIISKRTGKEEKSIDTKHNTHPNFISSYFNVLKRSNEDKDESKMRLKKLQSQRSDSSERSRSPSSKKHSRYNRYKK